MRLYLFVTFIAIICGASAQTDEIVLALGETIDREYGPSDAVYCLVEDPNGVTQFEGFGPCRIQIDAVTLDHQGLWKAQIGTTNRIVTEEYSLRVRTESRNTVVTEVKKVGYEIYVHCSIQTQHEFSACKFRNPHSAVYVPRAGQVDGRYSFDGTGVTLGANGMYNIDCGMKIDTPMTADLGLWRCAIETSHDTYYGFLTVICPWAMMDPNVAAVVVAEPLVEPERKSVVVGPNERLSLGCNIPATLDYCHFRSPSGQVYSVAQGIANSEFEYVGVGLDAGECGIRFNKAESSFSGEWRCNVGLTNQTAPEQQAYIQVVVNDGVSVEQRRNGQVLVVSGQVHAGTILDYCRFVRADGFSFSSRMPADGYVFEGSLSSGFCNLRIARPAAIDFEPWTIAARVSGQLQEVIGSEHHYDAEAPPTTPQPDNDGPSSMRIFKCTMYGLSIVVLVGAIVFLVIRQRKLKRSLNETSPGWRNSFITKEVAKTQTNEETKTPAVA